MSPKTTAKKTATKKTVAKKIAKVKIPLAQRRKARRLVVQALYQWLLAQTNPAEIEAQFREENTGKIDWDYFHDVFIQIPNNNEQLEQHLSPLLDREIDKLDPIERSLLLLGSYEMAHRVDVPYKVVINECVELAKIFGATDGHKYINGVLDKLAPILRAAETAK